MLTTLSSDDLKQYLIMERIVPPEVKAYMIRKGRMTVGLTYSELGIYSSAFIDTTKNFIENHTYGRLLRTKSIENNEGGINTGWSVID